MSRSLSQRCSCPSAQNEVALQHQTRTTLLFGGSTGPDMYYYEVIECGRRILLTGVLIFISPNTAAQAAAACMFAFLSLLGFELLRPHLDPTDSWLYRLVSGGGSCNGFVFSFSRKLVVEVFQSASHRELRLVRGYIRRYRMFFWILFSRVCQSLKSSRRAHTDVSTNMWHHATSPHGPP